jgi:hypothetical protein
MGSQTPTCLDGTPSCTLICNDEEVCPLLEFTGNRNELLSIASWMAFMAASVASPHEDAAEESMPNPILDMDKRVLLDGVTGATGATGVVSGATIGMA